MSKLIGKTVEITNKDNLYYGFKGTIIHFDGRYHVSGGNFDANPNGFAPVFNRDEFKVREMKYYLVRIGVNQLTVKAYTKAGARLNMKSHPHYAIFIEDCKTRGIKPEIHIELNDKLNRKAFDGE